MQVMAALRVILTVRFFFMPFFKAIAEFARRPQSLMIQGLRHLEKVDVADLDETAIGHLVQLPNLQYLEIQRISDLPSYTPDLCNPKFCRLRHLSLAGSPLSVTKFLALRDIWFLDRFEAELKPSVTTDELMLLFSELEKTFNPASLTVLTVDSSACIFDSTLPILGPVSLHGLHPILCFHHLRNVRLWLPAWVDLDDTTVEALARSWPELQTIELRRGPYGTDSCMTLRSLRVLVHRCPGLIYARIPFDASVVPVLEGPPVRSKAGYLCLHVEDANVVDPAAVAAYLLEAFPDLQIAGSLNRYTADEAGLGGFLLERLMNQARLWDGVGRRLHSQNTHR
ncbi:hypothetical protein C8R47DRAFT_1127911 [Mycena vitilis]|nr:hypothetical protein C8R47DRAFT_1127911 [Mycena vitilis]